jgi:integrase
MNAVVRAIGKESEIPHAVRITLHGLRHTSASRHYLGTPT